MLGHGWNILGGFAGQTSIGHGLFFGLGAYAVDVLHLGTASTRGSAWWRARRSRPLSGVAIGLPCFRLRGHYFVIATLVVAEICTSSSRPGHSSAVLRDCRSRSRRPASQASSSIATGPHTTTSRWRCWPGSPPAIWWLSARGSAIILQAIRDDEEALRSLGYSPARYKLIAMALSAAIVGAGGVFYAQYVLFIDPASVLTLALSVVIALILIFGGVGTVAGPILGAVVLVPISEYSRVMVLRQRAQRRPADLRVPHHDHRCLSPRTGS